MKFRLAFFKEHLLPALVCFGLAFELAQTEWLQRVESVSLDARTWLRAQFYPTMPNEQFALIGIDEPSLHEFGRWPWSREVHGSLMQLLGQIKPSVVAWDILFSEPSTEDEYFAKSIAASGAQVILGAERADADIGILPGDDAIKASRLTPFLKVEGDRSRIPTDPAVSLPTGGLERVAEIGFTDTPPESDGVRREAPLVVRIGEGVYPALSLQSLMQYWHATPEQVSVRLGDAITIENAFVRRRIPIDETGGYLINYRHALNGFVTYGYSETLTDLYHRFHDKQSVPVPQLTGRILLVGQVADGLSDFGPTPFSPLTPLVLVHANVIENVLNDDFARTAPPVPIWIGGFALTTASLAYFAKRKFREQMVFSPGVPVIYCLVATLCWAKFSVWVPIVWPVLGFGSAQIFMVGRRVIAEQRAKEQIKGMFGTYISPELVNRMVASGVSPQLGGAEEEITAYFSDIQSYSTFSEKLPPPQLVELLNEYLTACTDIVQEEGGTLDKYIGDAVVAMFGAPIALPDHAYRACLAALRVQQRLDELRVKWDGEGDRWPEGVRKMRSRIGLNSGPAIIGNMGSRTRFNYTMTGDNVNLAARMESGAKSWGVYAMTTEATKVACEKYGADRIVFRALGRIVVKGRTQAVPLYEIFSLKEQVTPAMRECLGLFEQGLARYYARDWDGALALFAQSRELELNVPGRTPGVSSNPSLVYLELTAKLKQSPPQPDWDGVFVMHEK